MKIYKLVYAWGWPQLSPVWGSSIIKDRNHPRLTINTDRIKVRLSGHEIRVAHLYERIRVYE